MPVHTHVRFRTNVVEIVPVPFTILILPFTNGKLGCFLRIESSGFPGVRGPGVIWTTSNGVVTGPYVRVMKRPFSNIFETCDHSTQQHTHTLIKFEFNCWKLEEAGSVILTSNLTYIYNIYKMVS